MASNRATRESERLHRCAVVTFPDGISHNIRYVDLHPIYLECVGGPYVWDVDGNRYVYFCTNHVVSVGLSCGAYSTRTIITKTMEYKKSDWPWYRELLPSIPIELHFYWLKPHAD